VLAVTRGIIGRSLVSLTSTTKETAEEEVSYPAPEELDASQSVFMSSEADECPPPRPPLKGW